MQVFSTISSIRKAVLHQKSIGKTTAFVPTMGGLHEGHLSLIRLAQQQADCVIVSIFVNQKQFNQGEDFEHYPRPIESDLAKLNALNVDFVFTPPSAEIFPNGAMKSTEVIVPRLSKILCGKSRPPFFIGIASIVIKLFNIIPADFAIFGKKDYQQLLVIRQMVQDLSIPIHISAGDTVREKDGLAMSSRNQYLSKIERTIAPKLYRQLLSIKKELRDNAGKLSEIVSNTNKNLTKLGFTMDYLEVLDADLNPLDDKKLPFIVLIACTIGKTRLIDNLEL